MGPTPGNVAPARKRDRGTVRHTAGDRPDTSWVRASRRDRCQHVPTRHDQTPIRSSGGDLTNAVDRNATTP